MKIKILYTYQIRYDNVTLIPLVLHLGLRIDPIQRMGAAPGVIHTGRFFCPNSVVSGWKN